MSEEKVAQGDVNGRLSEVGDVAVSLHRELDLGTVRVRLHGEEEGAANGGRQSTHLNESSESQGEAIKRDQPKFLVERSNCFIQRREVGVVRSELKPIGR